MSYKLQFSPEFRRDLVSIQEYIQNNNFNNNALHEVITGIFSTVNELIEYPESGSLFFLPDGTATEYRHILHRYSPKIQYEIFYNINDNAVFVERVLSTRMDYIKALFNDEWEG